MSARREWRQRHGNAMLTNGFLKFLMRMSHALSPNHGNNPSDKSNALQRMQLHIQ